MMKYMTSAEIRQTFLDFFEEQKHTHVASSSLVPGNDPTLLFANSGMVQFKDVFLGMDKRPYSRATTAQKCLRVSGKHNDLDNVGPSPRHHTFFEMLGNFSFGDYFKPQACRFAFDLLTKAYALPADRLYYTVHYDDDETFNIWTDEIGIPKERVHRLGDKDNFWQMADTGPCGYNSEIYFDWFPERGTDFETIKREFDEDTGRLVEIWNLVFMQFNQKPDGSREPLPKPSVDTGAGLERIASVLQGSYVNYGSDLFTPIMARIQQLAGQNDDQRKEQQVAYNVVADHMRAAAFLIADGVTPGPKDRGYVCRMLIRRAVRFGRKLGFMQPFLSEVAESVIEVMGGHYTELIEKRDAIRKAILQEEIRFGRTLERGLLELDESLSALPTGGQLPGDKAFFLKASLGLPFEVTRDIALERGYDVDVAGFQAAQTAHEIASGGDQAMGVIDRGEVYTKLLQSLQTEGVLPATGVAYDPYSSTSRDVTVLAVLKDGQPTTAFEVGDQVEVILDATPFYVESGGQVSDTGTIQAEGWAIEIDDVRRPVGGLVVHLGEVVEGQPQVGVYARAEVDTQRRLDIMRNHTATHLLHAQLREVLGSHVQQRGSLVAPERLRFDFSHDSSVSAEELAKLNERINAAIMQNMAVLVVEKDLQTARSEGAMALFGEKYGDRVRTVTVENGGSRYSYELCGGTHVASTAAIGPFVITAEGSVSQGVRRVEALTGQGAQQYIARQMALLRTVAAQLGATPEQIGDRIEALRDEVSAARNENAKLRRNLAKLEFDTVLGKLESVGDVPVLVAQVSQASPDTLREMTDWFRDKHKSGVVVLGTINDDKPQLIAAVTDDLTKRVHAGNLIKTVAAIVGGGGGGRPNMAQAGGKDSAKLGESLQAARQWISDALNKK